MRGNSLLRFVEEAVLLLDRSQHGPFFGLGAVENGLQEPVAFFQLGNQRIPISDDLLESGDVVWESCCVHG